MKRSGLINPNGSMLYAPFWRDLVPPHRIQLIAAHVQSGRTGTATKVYTDRSVLARLDPTADDPDPQPQMFLNGGFKRIDYAV
jgi:hypothetical protein